jgi:hypothetical protein
VFYSDYQPGPTNSLLEVNITNRAAPTTAIKLVQAPHGYSGSPDFGVIDLDTSRKQLLAVLMEPVAGGWVVVAGG